MHCFLSSQLTKVYFRILSLCMLSILGFNDMHFANLMIQTPNSMSRKLPIDLRIAPQSTTIYTYPHACPLIYSHFFSQNGYHGAALRALGSDTYTHTCLYAASSPDIACSEGIFSGFRSIQCRSSISSPCLNSRRARYMYERFRD